MRGKHVVARARWLLVLTFELYRVMAHSDTFLSDVHVGTLSPISEQGTVLSRFVFTLPRTADSSEAEVDEDGDLVVHRRKQHVLLIEHAMSTTLDNVGLQVWRGSLLMADYLLCQDSRLHDSVILELGAGTGLVSLIAALRAQCVFCTDTGQEVLELCKRNIDRNISQMECCGVVNVRELDWGHPFLDTPVGFSWSQKDMDALANVSVIFACDVIYDDVLTNSLFKCLVKLHSMIRVPPTIIISLEKRVNFSLEELAPVSTYYKHFRHCLESAYPFGKEQLKFHAHQIPNDFTQYCTYDRVKELELWELTTSTTERSSTARTKDMNE